MRRKVLEITLSTAAFFASLTPPSLGVARMVGITKRSGYTM